MTILDRPRRTRGPRASATDRLRRLTHEAHRQAFCLSVALDTTHVDQHDEPAGLIRVGMALPFSSTIREFLRHRPGVRHVGVASLLMGSQARLDSSGFAAAYGTLRYGSTPMLKSPHVELLRQAVSAARPLSDEEIRSSSYWRFARHVADTWGDFFGASTDDALLVVTRNFLDWSLSDKERITINSGSRTGDGVLVAKVPHSHTFQVIDGHHRVAAAIVRGKTTLSVQRTWLASETALQELLWRAGVAVDRRRVLAQPLPARELSDDWAVQHNCADRFTRMTRFLDDRIAVRGGGPAHGFLDVGAGYGWYVREFARAGWQAAGVEEDSLSVEIASSFHSLEPDAVAVGTWTEALAARAEPVDVVACLGLGARLLADPDGAGPLLAELDRVTGAALFVDATDESTDGVAATSARVLDGTSLRDVVDLGENADPSLPGSRGARTRLLAFTR